MDEYRLAMQVRAGEVFAVDGASTEGTNENSRKVGELVKFNTRQVGPIRITMERRIHVCTSVAADLIYGDLESRPGRIMRLSSPVVVGEKGAKLWAGQSRIGGHSRFEWVAEIDNHACLAQDDQPILSQQTLSR
jgi:hypothetical protein